MSGEINYERPSPNVTRADLTGLKELVNSRFDNVNIRIDDVKEAVSMSFDASEKANADMKQSQAVWNITHNELMQQMRDQQQKYVTRNLFDEVIDRQTTALLTEAARVNTKFDVRRAEIDVQVNAVTRLIWMGVGATAAFQILLGVGVSLLVLFKGGG